MERMGRLGSFNLARRRDRGAWAESRKKEEKGRCLVEGLEGRTGLELEYSLVDKIVPPIPA